MNTRHFGFTASLFGLGFLAFSAACADQPKPYCQTGRGEFVVKYDPASGPAECAARKGELLGLQSYNLPAVNGAPDPSKTPIAIQSVRMAEQALSAEQDVNVFSTGVFIDARPDEQDLCHVKMDDKPTTFTLEPSPAVEASSNAEDDKAAVPGFPGRTVTYQWTDLAFYVTAAAAGTQFQGTVTITDSSFAAGAACTYKAHGMFPSVSCGLPRSIPVEGAEPDEDGKVPQIPLEQEASKPLQCEPAAELDVAHGWPTGQNINPDFAQSCQDLGEFVQVQGQYRTRHICLPSKPFPSFK